MILYVQEQGSIVQRRGQSLEIRKAGSLVYQIPLIGLERLVIIGYIQVTTQALHALSGRGIDVVYLSRSGQVRFMLHTPKADNVFLRLAQYERYMDKPYALALAKNIVFAKLSSQMDMIRNHKWSDGFYWKGAIAEIQALQGSIIERKDLNALRGVEGSASRVYFRSLGSMLTKMRLLC